MAGTTLRVSVLLGLLLALPASAADIIPCAVGNKWEYDTVKLLNATVTHQGKVLTAVNDTSSGKAVYEVVSADTSVSPVVYDYKESTTMWSTKGGEAETDVTTLKITSGEDGLRILSTYREANEEKPESQTYDPALLYYSSKLAEAGKSWDVGTMRDGETTNAITAHGAGRETVTVPAGTFKDCLKVVYVGDRISGTMDMWEKRFTITGGKSRGIYWIADGVGVVKELEISTSASETPGPDGKPVIVEAASCTVSELRPGYIVRK